MERSGGRPVRTRIGTGLALLLLAGMVAGCGSDGLGSDGSKTSPSVTQAGGATTTTDATGAEAGGPLADAVVAAYQDEALWQKLSTRGVANVARHFSFDAARDAVQAVLPRR